MTAIDLNLKINTNTFPLMDAKFTPAMLIADYYFLRNP